jgi:hypothetical protein
LESYIAITKSASNLDGNGKSFLKVIALKFGSVLLGEFISDPWEYSPQAIIVAANKITDIDFIILTPYNYSLLATANTLSHSIFEILSKEIAKGWVTKRRHNIRGYPLPIPRYSLERYSPVVGTLLQLRMLGAVSRMDHVALFGNQTLWSLHPGIYFQWNPHRDNPA